MSDRITHAFGYPYINSIPDFIADHNGDTDCHAIAYTDTNPYAEPPRRRHRQRHRRPRHLRRHQHPSRRQRRRLHHQLLRRRPRLPRQGIRLDRIRLTARLGGVAHSDGNTSTRLAFKLGIKVVVQTNGYLYFVR